MSKKNVIVLLVLILLVVIIVVVAGSGSKKQPAVTQTPTTTTKTPPAPAVQTDVKAVAPDSVPSQLPANIPWEPGAQILQNFEAKDPATGKTQSTRVYVSAKTLDANFTIYQKFFSDNGWTVSSTIDQPTIKNFSATKNGSSMSVTIASSNGKNTVNVSMVY